MSAKRVLVEKDALGNATLVSESGRTRVSASFNNKGNGTVIVTRDNFIVQRIDLPNEAKIN